MMTSAANAVGMPIASVGRLEARDEPLRRERRHHAADAQVDEAGAERERWTGSCVCSAGHVRGRSSMRMKKHADDRERDARRQRDALAVAA